MNEILNKIQAVINTLEGLEIKSNRNTMMQLLGCMKILEDVKNELAEGGQDGNDHAE